MGIQERPLVSIIIPCYNQARFVGKAIESALNQTYAQREIIVVDDGSADDTFRVAMRYPGVRLIRQKNLGLAGARNTGLRASTGAFLVFLDADDRLLPAALEVGVNALLDRADCAFVFGQVRLIAADGSLINVPPPARLDGNAGDAYEELLRHNPIWTPGAVVYRRKVLDVIGAFDASARFKGCEDYDLSLRIARRFPVLAHDRIILEYRKHGANMSGNAGLMLSHFISVLRSNRAYARGHPRYEAALDSGIRSVREDYGEKAIRELSENLRRHNWGRVLKGGYILLRHYPRGLAAHASAKLLRLLFKGRRSARRSV